MMIATWPGRRSASRPASARRCSVSASKVEVLGIMQMQISITAYRPRSVGADRDDGDRQTDQLTQPAPVRPARVAYALMTPATRSRFRAGTPEPLDTPADELLELVTKGYVP